MTNILQMLEHTAEMYPEKVAAVDPSCHITFSQLLVRAKKIGSFLAKHTSAGCPVPMYLDKSVTSLCGMLGVIYAGCHYVFIDLRHPESRVQAIEHTLSPSLVLSDKDNMETAVSFFSAPVYTIETILEKEDIDEPALLRIREQSLDVDPLYVNFTSGSTGTPKGVTVAHRSVIDFILTFTDLFHITEKDIIGNQAPFDFDVSVKDIYSCLFTGATLVIIPRPYFSNPTTLMDYICENQITILIWAVSAMCFVSIMNGFQYRNPTSLRTVMFSGEVMPIKQFNIWKQYQPHVHFVNLYGPTEITCNCTYYILEDRLYGSDEKIPIGKPFANEKVFLLDDDDNLITEPDTEGELCVSGTCLALGYYGDPVRTQESFVQNPLNTKWNELIYRTGDLCCYNSLGDLVYLSRKDFQVKHLGHRIELGDIESAANACEGVLRSCCLYDSKKKKILLFYAGIADKDTLVNNLKILLPNFMLPNKLISVDSMPLTKNGKIDRNALKEIGGITP